jgi:hypothetical protein
MEIPCKPQTPTQGDFTLLGMEFETIPEVLSNGGKNPQNVSSADMNSRSNSPQVLQHHEWKESDFKFVKKENPVDSFGCSQLEIPFSQLDGKYEGKMSASQSDSYTREGKSASMSRRSDNPSTHSLRARGYRTKANISVSLILTILLEQQVNSHHYFMLRSGTKTIDAYFTLLFPRKI